MGSYEAKPSFRRVLDLSRPAAPKGGIEERKVTETNQRKRKRIVMERKTMKKRISFIDWGQVDSCVNFPKVEAYPNFTTTKVIPPNPSILMPRIDEIEN